VNKAESNLEMKNHNDKFEMKNHNNELDHVVIEQLSQ
jgi:hypothetical protein